MKNLRRRFERFCFAHRDKGIPNLMLYISLGAGMVYLFTLATQSGFLYDMLCFDRARILQGQIWRLISYPLVSASGANPLLVLIFLVCYYYYAHLQKDHPFAEGLKVGDVVQAGDLIGFMGRTGYSDRENVNNIETVHLHFGMQLIFDESQKECNSEIWVDVYDIVRLLSGHRSSIVKTADGWKRLYPYTDLDIEELYNPFSSEEESLG